MTRWQCPVCQQPLNGSTQPWRCENNHSFDLAKEGYANLLLANQKRRPSPGDNRDMIHARREFLHAGFYSPLVQALVEQLIQLKAQGFDARTQAAKSHFLDIGCGEGYYSQQIAKAMPCQIAGVDISRDAIRLAAKNAPHNAQFAVASSKRLPLASAQFDAALAVFAPFEPQEVARVLRPAGTLVVVSPGANHLLALRQFIYPSLRPHRQPDVPLGFKLSARHAVEFTIACANAGELANLLAMTPFAYKLNDTQKAAFLAQCSSLQADFLISVYEVSGEAATETGESYVAGASDE